MSRILLLVLFAIGSFGCSDAKNSNPKPVESNNSKSGVKETDADSDKGSSKAD